MCRSRNQNLKNSLCIVWFRKRKNSLEENESRSYSYHRSFRQNRFSRHHQQSKQGSTELKGTLGQFLFQFYTALLTLLMMIADSMWSKRPILRIILDLFSFPQAIFVPHQLQSEAQQFL